MAPPLLTAVSFFAGYGGIDLGLHQIFGQRLRTIAYCEREAYAVANILSKMDEGLLEAAPVWTDVASFPYADFHGSVDIAHGGVPCQPHSSAGSRKGGADERFMFDVFIEGLALMRPRYVFIENVVGLLSSRMPDGTLCIRHVLNQLERIGYCVETDQGEPCLGIFSAEECGSPQQRKRVFILGRLSDPIGMGLEGRSGIRQNDGQEREAVERICDLRIRESELAHSESGRARPISAGQHDQREGEGEFDGGGERVQESAERPVSSGERGRGQPRPDSGRSEIQEQENGSGPPIESGDGGEVHKMVNPECSKRGPGAESENCGKEGREAGRREGAVGAGGSGENMAESKENLNHREMRSRGRRPGYTVSRQGEPQHDWEPSRITLPSALLDLWNRIRANPPPALREAIAGREASEDFRQALGKMGLRVDGPARELDDDNSDELRLLGNGCYPDTVALAFATLYGRIKK